MRPFRDELDTRPLPEGAIVAGATTDEECAFMAGDMASPEDLIMARDILRAIDVWKPLTTHRWVSLGPRR